MEGLCDFFTEQLFFNKEVYSTEDHDGINTAEIYFEDQMPQIQRRRIPTHDMVSWLDRRTSARETAPSSNHFSIRIIWIELLMKGSHGEMNIQRSLLDLILDHFTLKRAYWYNHTGHHGLTRLPEPHASHDDVQPYAIYHSGFHRLTWMHNPRASEINAIFVGDEYRCYLMNKAMMHLKHLSWHPMFLAAISSAAMVSWIERGHGDCTRDVREVEVRTEHNPSSMNMREPATGSYATLSAKMSGNASRLADLDSSRRTVDRLLGDLSAFVLPEKERAKSESNHTSADFHQCIQLLQHRLESTGLMMGCCSRRTDIQVTAVSSPTPRGGTPDLLK